MKRLKINRIDFELAFELGSDEATTYLDSKSGAVIFVEEYITTQLDKLLTDEETLDAILSTLQDQANLSNIECKQLTDAARVETDAINRYRMIPKQSSHEGYHEMQEYIQTLEEGHLSELLEVAIQGSGAFRRFKNVLYNYSEAQDNWFKFCDVREQQRILDWLASENIQPDFE
jgi:hypothetical protein